MIRTLRVRDLALIDEIELGLEPGLNVLTGETGAGKSVLLGAIAALCGRRVSSESIRSGASSATVEAILEGPEIGRRAAALGLTDGPARELLVSRRIVREGRGRVLVDGSLATVALLSELLSEGIQVASQGEHQELLRAEVQSHLLDLFGGLAPRVDRVSTLHAHWHRLAREIHRRRACAEERTRDEERLRFELDQIDSVDPRPGELEALEAEHARLAHVDRLGEEVAGAGQLLDGEGGAREQLGRLDARLREAIALDPGLGEAGEALERARIELEELAATFERTLSSLEADPGRLASVEERLLQLAGLQRRYGPTLEAILAYRERARRELEELEGGEARTAELEAEQVGVAAALDTEARRLEQDRRRAAAGLESALARELEALGLPGASLVVRWEPLAGKTREGWPAPCSPRGRERASFQLAANPGEEPRALRDAASGGELSRLLLAVRSVLAGAEAAGGGVPGRVLLFDEVDAGIGGATARRVGERLRALGSWHQVICITHLPQIAALGRTHYRVGKQAVAGRNVTRVERLEGELRVEEIARMLSGGRVTDAARVHARELLSC